MVAGQIFARVDLPRNADERCEVDALLRQPVREHAGDRLVLLAYSWDREAATAALTHLHSSLGAASIQDLLYVQGDGWESMLGHVSGVVTEQERTAIAAEMVARGTPPPLASREGLAEQFAPGPQIPERLLDLSATRLGGLRREGGLDRERLWAMARATRFMGDRLPLSDQQGARLVTAVAEGEVRDGIYPSMRDDPDAHTALWSDLSRRTSGALRNTALTMAAASHYFAGSGAAAWTALDQLDHADPKPTLVLLLEWSIQRGVPPGVLAEALAQPPSAQASERSVSSSRDMAPPLSVQRDGPQVRGDHRPPAPGVGM